MRCRLSAIFLLLASGSALADPGHAMFGRTLEEWLHLISEPEHVAGLALLVVLVVGATIAVRRAREGRDRDPR